MDFGWRTLPSTLLLCAGGAVVQKVGVSSPQLARAVLSSLIAVLRTMYENLSEALKNMNAVILFSHGSLLCGAGEALQKHAARLRARKIAPIVEVGYLNYSEPLFMETVTKCVAMGADRIVVTPYFLVPGYFVKVDLPKAVKAAQEAFPELPFVIAEALGFDERLADSLIDSALSAQDSRFWRMELANAAKFCRPSPTCPLYESTSCPKKPGVRKFGVESGQRIESSPSIVNQISEAHKCALMVMVHGSPRPIANAEMFKTVELIKARKLFRAVEVGFMECNEPNIPDAIDACVSSGADEIIAVPYFLHTGTHVADDLPTLLEEGEVKYPEVKFSMGDFLGNSERLTAILEDRTKAILALQSGQ